MESLIVERVAEIENIGRLGVKTLVSVGLNTENLSQGAKDFRKMKQSQIIPLQWANNFSYSRIRIKYPLFPSRSNTRD